MPLEMPAIDWEVLGPFLWLSLGGLATLRKHGPRHMREIGKRGAATTWKRYQLRPAGIADFAMIDRQTGEVKAYLSGRNQVSETFRTPG